MPKIRLLHLRDSRGIYGAERAILTLARYIDHDRFNFGLLCLKGRDAGNGYLMQTARAMGIPLDIVPVNGRLDLSAIRQIRGILQARSPSILHAHDFKTTFYALLASWNLGVKRVVTAHGSTRDSMRIRAYLLLDERIIYRFFDRVLAVGEAVATDLRKKGIPPERIQVIPNAVELPIGRLNPDDARLPARVGQGRRQPVFGVIGRLFPDKGHRYFLEAFRHLVNTDPACRAIFVGGGPLEPVLRARISTLALSDHIRLYGMRADMDEVYAETDVVVIPSLREGLPYVLLEALAHRRPVIATQVGDIPRVIRHEQTGLLVPPGDARALAAAMGRLLRHPEEGARMAENGHRLVAQEYSAHAMVSQTERLYEALLEA